MISNQVDPLGRARWEVLGLFADDDAARRATTWAREVLESASVDPSGQQLRALRALRRADRRLSLPAARYLLTMARGSGERGQRIAPRAIGAAPRPVEEPVAEAPFSNRGCVQHRRRQGRGKPQPPAPIRCGVQEPFDTTKAPGTIPGAFVCDSRSVLHHTW